VRLTALEDLREEVRSSLTATGLFATVVTTETLGVDLMLRPVIQFERMTHSGESDPLIALSVRFELRSAGSNGMVWEREYTEKTPPELLFQIPFPDRARLIASRIIRHRIVESLRLDLTRFLLGY